ncbi:MAG: hypothetical protein ABII75_00975 [Candidatus Omnitrophota bacterium]
MAGKVFISSGQRPPDERKIIEKISKLLKDKFELDSYVAFTLQGLNDVMKIMEELKKSDYFLFIDFYRDKDKEIPISIFTHQELALACHVGFNEILAFQDERAPSVGILPYIQANPVKFSSTDALINKIESIIKERQWSKKYSRNLQITSIDGPYGPMKYGDHTGASIEYIWHARIDNNRSDASVVNAVCVLDTIVLPNGQSINSPDRSPLKWARQHNQYQGTILPLDFGCIDVCAIRADKAGLFMHSSLDQTPRIPVCAENGKYTLNYKVFAQGFPILRFVLDVNLNYIIPKEAVWENNTAVEYK